MPREITPESLAASGTEHGHQSALFCWASLAITQRAYPQLKWMHAIPNGGQRNAATAGRLKAEGVKKGVWDVLWPYKCGGYSGLYIEMKVRPNKPDDRQLEFGAWVSSQGFYTVVCYSWLEARDAIIAYANRW